MSRFVRASKYRHVFGSGSKRDQCYDNIRVSRNAWDTNLCKANGRFISINLEAGGGGQFAVIPLEQTGKLAQDYAVYAGHTAAVLDTDFNPFNDYVIASCGEDCKVLVWSIPSELPKENLTAPVCSFTGHNRKVGHVLFHPTAENILLSSGADLVIKLYDIEQGAEKAEVTGHPDIVNSVQWSYDGSMLATSCKDKNLRVIDPRANVVQHCVASHQGVKGTRVCWLGDSDRIFTSGFSRSSDRQWAVWDLKNMKEPLKMENMDTMSGGLIPHFDNDTKMLYLAGKGDGNIRYYEYADEAPYIFPLSEYKSSDPQRGLAFLPKRCLNIGECEISRVYKVHPDRVEPISFKVPRKSDQFQSDIFPETAGDKAALTADQWLAGKNAKPILISLEKGFVASAGKKEFVSNAIVANNDVRDPLKNPSSEKEYKDAFHALRKELDA
jgi:coronin-1B/1C/6